VGNKGKRPSEFLPSSAPMVSLQSTMEPLT
jgi:hypothetical protein